ncbi:MAG: hypothetical protein ACM3SV_14500 [Betaproteobacteria bacterium]
MIQHKLGLSALALEMAAWSGLVLGEKSDLALLAYLTGHAGASALLALLLYLFLPRQLRSPRLPILLLMFGLGFAVPILGFVGLGAGILVLRRQRAVVGDDPIHAVRLPAIDPHQRAVGAFHQTGLGSFLANERVPVNNRLRALVALQNVPGRVASPLLRNVLSDPSEDIRLLAYGMLDNQEKGLNNLIHAERGRYSEATNDADRTAAARRLSDLYWELVYQELAQGDLRHHALLQSQQYTVEALRQAPDDAALHLRLGRLRQMLGDAPAARLSYERALDLGMPRTRITPYLAELAFDVGDYAIIPAYMAELAEWHSLPRLKPVVEYWSGGVRA